MPTLRPTTRADLPAVDALLALSYPRLLAADYAPSVLVTALPRVTRAQTDLLIGGTYFILTDGDVTLAAGGWTRTAPGRDGAVTPGIGHVRHVVSHPDHLRRGHARQLMIGVLTQARVAGTDALDCLSTLTAQPFYAALGFVGVSPVDVILAPGIIFPTVRMRLRL
ncbi:MAG: GNAT family N-acetyltransferase [Jannaschia sp.]